MEKYIDLHTHTTASDGSMKPEALVRYAAQCNLSALAITDHDTVEGIAQAIIEGNKMGVEIIPGIEISVEFESEMHILGYYIDIASKDLGKHLDTLKQYRDERNPCIVKKLNDLGLAISLDEVEAKANSKVIGRPHIAAVLVEKGYVKSTDEAFEKYLGQGKAAYTDKQKLSPEEGIQLITKAGGLPVLAHPIYLHRDDEYFEKLLQELIGYGLKGIEVYYTEHSPELQHKYEALANKYHLVKTGGSDFHGSNKPDIHLGKGHGNLQIAYEVLENLKASIVKL